MKSKIERMTLLRKQLGLSRPEMTRRFGIPFRTVEKWEQGVQFPSEWVIDLVLFRLEYEINNRTV